jgi:hypothetical protein
MDQQQSQFIDLAFVFLSTATNKQPHSNTHTQTSVVPATKSTTATASVDC